DVSRVHHRPRDGGRVAVRLPSSAKHPTKGLPAMKRLIALALGAGLLAATPALAAIDPIVAEICPACTSIVLTGNADFQATGGRNFIDFPPQATGSAPATFTGPASGGRTVIDIVAPYNTNS